MKIVSYWIILIFIILLIGCDKENHDEFKERVPRSIEFGDHKIDVLLTDRATIALDVDNDKKGDVKITYYKYVEAHEDCCLQMEDSVTTDTTYNENRYISGNTLYEIYRLLEFTSLNDSVFLCIYSYDEIYLFDDKLNDFKGLKWKSSFGNYVPIEFLDEENYLPIKIMINQTSKYYGWIYFKSDGVSDVDLINYRIVE